MTSSTSSGKTKQGGPLPPATASGGDDRSGGHDESAVTGQECTSWDCALTGIFMATALAALLTLHALVTFGDQPASLVLELSCVLCTVLFAWAWFVTRQLTAEGRGARRLSSDELRRVMWWIVHAGAVAVLAGWAFGTVAAMLVMYAASLGVAGLLAWCLGEYYRTRDSTDTTSAATSHEQEKPMTTTRAVSQDASSQKNSSTAKTKGPYQLVAQEQEDLEAGFRRDNRMACPGMNPMVKK